MKKECREKERCSKKEKRRTMRGRKAIIKR